MSKREYIELPGYEYTTALDFGGTVEMPKAWKVCGAYTNEKGRGNVIVFRRPKVVHVWDTAIVTEAPDARNSDQVRANTEPVVSKPIRAKRK